jgi:hypothetical protein
MSIKDHQVHTLYGVDFAVASGMCNEILCMSPDETVNCMLENNQVDVHGVMSCHLPMMHRGRRNDDSTIAWHTDGERLGC